MIGFRVLVAAASNWRDRSCSTWPSAVLLSSSLSLQDRCDGGFGVGQLRRGGLVTNLFGLLLSSTLSCRW